MRANNLTVRGNRKELIARIMEAEGVPQAKREAPAAIDYKACATSGRGQAEPCRMLHGLLYRDDVVVPNSRLANAACSQADCSVCYTPRHGLTGRLVAHGPSSGLRSCCRRAVPGGFHTKRIL